MPQTPEQDQKPAPKRRRGAPLGNRNALKYGFYAKKHIRPLRFNPEKDDLNILKEQVDMLRTVFHRMFASVTPETSLRDMLEVCRVLFYTTNAFNQLVNAVYQPEKGADPLVYDWQFILERIKKMDPENPDRFFPPSPFYGR